MKSGRRRDSGKPINDHETYTVAQLADAIGYPTTSEWVRRNVLDKGCPFRMEGRKEFISGRDYRLWVERENPARQCWQGSGLVGDLLVQLTVFEGPVEGK